MNLKIVLFLCALALASASPQRPFGGFGGRPPFQGQNGGFGRPPPGFPGQNGGFGRPPTGFFGQNGGFFGQNGGQFGFGPFG
ncbi:34 kDa spicule matrix protein-like [Penaeus chinensis]|uniref:34 kDa spicule matrix protein-like n=1 Tax=Penaeus chinensis TaxID=139456 RepID=UPI001FB7B9B0|nr:34 kDa spicule matrix protein-like [Penaeus chinensis]